MILDLFHLFVIPIFYQQGRCLGFHRVLTNKFVARIKRRKAEKLEILEEPEGSTSREYSKQIGGKMSRQSGVDF